MRWENFLIDLFNLVVFLPHFFGDAPNLYDWFLLLGIALVIALIWQRSQGDNPERERRYYYFLRIFVRFKLASILFVAGFLKLFAIFTPELSLSHLNTGYGYFADWKHLLLSLSVAPAYLVFLGVVEVAAALLLLFRRTSFLAVIIIIPFYGNVFLANLAYGGAYYLSCLYIVLLTVPIFLYDLQRLGSLVVNLNSTFPSGWKFDWNSIRAGRWRWAVKLLFAFVFILAVGLRSYRVSTSESLFYPTQKGLIGIAGKYTVESFVLNGDSIPCSSEHPARWKDVVFEEWNTLSVRINDTIQAAHSTQLFDRVESARDYEYTQTGDRKYYRYQSSAENSKLSLKNPNPAYQHDQVEFEIQRPDSTHVYLFGRTASGDSLRVQLAKVDKKYLLKEIKKVGRRKLGFRL